MNAHAINHPKMEGRSGLRMAAILNLTATVIVIPVIFLLTVMAASGNAAFEGALGITIFACLYAIIGQVLGIRRTWKEAPNRKMTVFFQLSWLVALVISIAAMGAAGG